MKTSPVAILTFALFACSSTPTAPVVSISEQDRELLEIVLEDALVNGELHRGDKSSLYVLSELADAELLHRHIPSDLGQTAQSIPAKLIQSLLSRNIESRRAEHSFESARLVVVEALEEADVALLLPGVAEDGSLALVCFYIPWPHGAEGYYLLKRVENSWEIQWRKYVYHA